MSEAKIALVIGASGFLGSHLVKELIKQDYSVRILVRASSNIKTLKGLTFEKFIGDVGDLDSLKAAMQGCHYVFHSAVNTGAWLNDSGPLYKTNVLGTINSVRAAKAAEDEKFVLTSSLVTIGSGGVGGSQMASEASELSEKDMVTEYTRTRFLAEQYVLNEFRESGFPAVAGCVSNTYGPCDSQPTPHGNLVKLVAEGRLPFYFGAAAEVVGVVDAAKGLILAAERGISGERYIFSERYLSNRELLSIAAKHAGRKPPARAINKSLLGAAVWLAESASRVAGKQSMVSANSIKMMYETWPLNHQKATDELGWRPAPIEQSIQQAVDYYLAD